MTEGSVAEVEVQKTELNIRIDITRIAIFRIEFTSKRSAFYSASLWLILLCHCHTNIIWLNLMTIRIISKFYIIVKYYRLMLNKELMLNKDKRLF